MGKLSVVGIGPGDYDNMTVRADRALKNSQVTRLGDDYLIESEVVYSDVHGDH